MMTKEEATMIGFEIVAYSGDARSKLLLAIEKAKKMILDIARVAHVGEIFDGTVVRIESYGCFVNLFNNVDGLCHVSKLSHSRVNHPKDVVKVGQKLKVIVTDIDEKGRINLSHKEFEPKIVKEKEETAEKAEEKSETKVSE